MLTWFLCLSAYLIGSLSSAIILCRLAGYPDPRTQGSHNPGATNVMRTTNKTLAAIVLLGDALKGSLAVSLALFAGVLPDMLGWIGLAAVLGHVFPIYFGFKGGKGVATAAGVLLVLAWPVAVIALAVWLLMFGLFRISSLSALLAVVSAPVSSWLLTPNQTLAVTAISVLVIACHHENIRRLLIGKEAPLKK